MPRPLAKRTGARKRAYTHAHLPVSRRYTYTPELLADGRRRYERTDEPIVGIAADFGIHKTTFQRMAKREGWVRFAPPPRDLSPAARLARAAEKLELASIRHPEARAQRASKGDGPDAAAPAGRPSFEARPPDGGLAPQDDGESGQPASTPGRVAEMLAVVDNELAAVKTMRAQLKTVPQGPEAAERTSRTLANLTGILERLHRLQHATPQPTGTQPYDDMPADLDEFRLDLARRIAAFMESRPDDADAGEPAAASAGEA